MTKPRLFIGSSTDRLEVAEKLAKLLKPCAAARCWTDRMFKISMTNIESLTRIVDENDFVVMILGADDIRPKAATSDRVPRDNVIFELGLAVGRLGRHRCFPIVERDPSIKLPTDLDGVSCGYFRPSSTKPRTSPDEDLRMASKLISKEISEIGKRPTLIREPIGDIRSCHPSVYLGGGWDGYKLGGRRATLESQMTIEQHGSFIRANVVRRQPRAGKFEYEGRLHLNQITLLFREQRPSSPYAGAMVLNIDASPLRLTGIATYYHIKTGKVISERREYRKVVSGKSA